VKHDAPLAAEPARLDELVRVLAPAGGPISAFLAAAAPGVEPFVESRRAAVAALSKAFLEDPTLRRDPASVAVAYWMRPAAIGRLHELHARRAAAEPGIVRVPVGRVFHVAPSNVDTLFVYSWVLSYLCGNANLVRVSQEANAVVEAMLGAFAKVAAADADLRDANRFVTYAHDAAVTSALSRWCSHRIVWGGDETVAALRPLPLGPHASERVFGSKFSYALLDAARWLAAGDAERTRLAGAFFNDLFWFDQMACSSPHVVFWVGGADAFGAAMASFEDALQAEVERRGYAPQAPDAVRRLNYAFGLAADADVRVNLDHSGFVGVRMNDRGALDREMCGGGLVKHARLDDPAELVTFAAEVDQTVTHWGFDTATLRALAMRLGARGVDRLVPVGEALAFDFVWDGFDLIEDLTRKVAVRGG
jgi:hypothetical protein